MDPNANLEEMRRLADQIIAADGCDDARIPPNAAERLAELVQALDAWISKGGFLPRDWQPK